MRDEIVTVRGRQVEIVPAKLRAEAVVMMTTDDGIYFFDRANAARLRDRLTEMLGG